MGDLDRVVGVVVDLLQVLAALFGAILVAGRLRGPARSAGIAGCLLLLASAGITVVYRLVLLALVTTVHLPYAAVDILFDLTYGLLGAAGTVVLVWALLLAARQAPPSGPPHR